MNKKYNNLIPSKYYNNDRFCLSSYMEKEHSYPFNPRMMFKMDDKWIWQSQQIDISKWKFYWSVKGQTMLKTMDEFDEVDISET